ncbi:hypothetical protein ROHU_031360 [Labeo rohita]|uniref:Uncharacterized protein n=1 Tax=Labeo rohita TaxID=84645 RepID=A0A498LPX8_LABRO|nr:hypothetical protein ROHU_031360 [Labeo rohita]
MVMNQIRQKAFEISILERQKEKNDFLVSLRTASGLIVFYWDKGLEHFESPAFYVEFMDSLKKWAELTKAVARGTIVYSLHVYKKLSEVGFGISEINRFLHRVRHISLTLEGNDIYSNEKTILERCIHSLFAIPEDVIEKVKQKHGTDNQLLLPLRVIRTVFLEIWTNLLAVEDFLYGRTEYQQPQRNFVQAVRQILEKLKQYTDLVDGFDEIIDPTVFVSLTDEDYEMADKLFTFEAKAFLKLLDNLIERGNLVIKDNDIKKTGTDMQDLWMSVKEMIKRINAEEGAKGHDKFIVALRFFRRLAELYEEEVNDLLSALLSKDLRESFGLFKGIFKNGMDLWKVAQPQMVKVLKVAAEVGKIDINQLFDKVKNAVLQLREKAMEISALEEQNEQDEFVITLRTVSGVLAFYWDKLVEYTESRPFHNMYLAAVRRWKELRVLKNTEKYHTIISPETGLQVWTWADERFGDLFDSGALEYVRWGNGIFGDKRFSQSNCAIMKIVTVYPLPIYEKLSEIGLGISEVNVFFIATEDTLTELVGKDILSNLRGVLYEMWNIVSSEILHVSINKKNQIIPNVDNEDPLRHLQSFNSVTQMVFNKYVKMIDGLEERISASTKTLRKLMLKTFSATNTVLVNSLAFLLSD